MHVAFNQLCTCTISSSLGDACSPCSDGRWNVLAEIYFMDYTDYITTCVQATAQSLNKFFGGANMCAEHQLYIIMKKKLGGGGFPLPP